MPHATMPQTGYYIAEGLMPVPAHRHRETFSHLIGSYGYILYGRQPTLYIQLCASWHTDRSVSCGKASFRSQPEKNGQDTAPMTYDPIKTKAYKNAFYHMYVCPTSAHRGFRYEYRRYKDNTFTLKTTLFGWQSMISRFDLTLSNINMSKNSTFV